MRFAFRFHPAYGVRAAFNDLVNETPDELNDIIRESYGTSFINCRADCLILLPQKTSSAYTDSTLIVLTAYYGADFTTINPVGLSFVMKETKRGKNYKSSICILFYGQLHSEKSAKVLYRIHIIVYCPIYWLES